MNDWPTAWTMVWLGVGAACLLWTLLVLVRRGVAGGLSLAVLFVWTSFVGYHLTPWLALDTGIWTSSLLRGTYIDAALMSSALSMVAFIAGYSSQIRLLRGKRPFGAHSHLLRVPPPVVVLLTFTVLFLFLVNVRGLENVFFANYGRGWGQFDYTFQGRLFKILYIFLLVSTVLLSFWSSLLILDRHSPLLLRLFIGWLGLFVSCLPLAHSLSRGAGLPLLMFFLLSIYLRGFRAALVYGIVGVLGIYFCFVGYDGRQFFQPGLANFALAATYRGQGPSSFDAFVQPIEVKPALNPGKDNFFNALDPWTLSAQQAAAYTGSIWQRLTTFLSVLQPLPSLFVPLTSRVGPALSEVVGVSGRYGITTPALAEMHYLFGSFSATFYLLYGVICGWIDRRYATRPSVGLLAIKLFIAAGFVLALHSGLRASTRFALYGTILFLLAPWVAGKTGIQGGRSAAPCFSKD